MNINAEFPFGDPQSTTTIDNEVMRTNLTFSGLPAAILYNSGALSLKWNICGEFTEAQAQQVVFHCYWGTYKEDFGVLSQITNNANWQKRDEMARAFQKSNMVNKELEINLIVLRYFAKLSSASQTGWLAQGTRQVAFVPVFGGKRTMVLGEEFFKYLDENTPAGSGGLILQGIEADLINILKGLTTRLKTTGGIQDDAGTCQWLNAVDSIRAEVLDGTADVHPVQLQVRENCQYFLG